MFNGRTGRPGDIDIRTGNYVTNSGVYNVEYSNGLEMGKKIKCLKKRKKKFFEDLTILAVPNGKM